MIKMFYFQLLFLSISIKECKKKNSACNIVKWNSNEQYFFLIVFVLLLLLGFIQ